MDTPFSFHPEELALNRLALLASSALLISVPLAAQVAQPAPATAPASQSAALKQFFEDYDKADWLAAAAGAGAGGATCAESGTEASSADEASKAKRFTGDILYGYFVMPGMGADQSSLMGPVDPASTLLLKAGEPRLKAGAALFDKRRTAIALQTHPAFRIRT